MMSVFTMLNAEWKVGSTSNASSFVRLLGSAPVIEHTIDRNGVNKQRTQQTPTVLIMKWENAVLLADTLVPDAAIIDVMVVPMFSPSTMKIPNSTGMAPVAQIVIVMAMIAAED